MWKTRVTELPGVELPIIGEAMQWLSRASFETRVNDALGMGVITSAISEPTQETFWHQKYMHHG